MKKISILLSLFICIYLFQLSANAQTVYYVDAAKPNNSLSGTSWATAFKDLQNAINVAISGDQIWVKAGTYYPTAVPPLSIVTSTTVRDKSFHLKPAVTIYGGFNGTETILTQRNWQANSTILSGDIGNINDSTDNCYHVIITASFTDTCRMDGFTITKGNANGTGLIFVGGYSFDRSYGAGVASEYSYTIFSNCTFTKHFATYGGAGIYNHITSNMVKNCIFTHNKTNGDAAAMYNSSSNILGTNCVFFNNNASGYAGAMYNSNLNSTFTNCVFAQNTAGQKGGAIYSIDDYSFYGKGTNLINCTFYNNQAIGASSQGGGIAFSTNSSAPIKNCIFWNNTTPNNNTDPADQEDINHNTVINGPQYSLINVSNSIVSNTNGSPTNMTFFTCSSANPLFVNTNDLDGADNKWGTNDDGLRIQSTSPAIDFGLATITTPVKDITGFTRTGVFDIGAYEYYLVCSPNTGSINVSICQGSSYTFNGVARTTAGLYKDTLTNYLGCDSVLALNLSIKTHSLSYVSQTICISQLPYSYLNHTMTGAGRDTLFLSNYKGCDSLAILNLIVTPLSHWYLDADNDGYYIKDTMACTSPGTGWNQTATNMGDCKDNDNGVHVPILYYVDNDLDGYGTTATALLCSSFAPSGYAINNTDCNDANSAINPGAPEISDNIDNNCNGQIDEGFCNPFANFIATFNTTTKMIDISYTTYTTEKDTFYIVRSGYNYKPTAVAMSTIDGLKTYSYLPKPSDAGFQIRCWVKGKCKMNTTTISTAHVYINLPACASCPIGVSSTTIVSAVASSCTNGVVVSYTSTPGTWGTAYQIAYRKIGATPSNYLYKNVSNAGNSGSALITLTAGAGTYEFLIRRRLNTINFAYDLFSPVQTFTLNTFVTCNRITDLVATYNTCSQMNISWSAANCAVQKYTVRYWLNGTSNYWGGIQNITSTSINFNGLKGTRTYKFYVVPVYCNGANGPNSDTSIVTYTSGNDCTNPLSRMNNHEASIYTDDAEVEEPISQVDFTLFPNPSNGTATITWSNNLTINSIDIFNTIGVKIKSYWVEGAINEWYINEKFATGQYLIQLRTVDGKTIHKYWTVQN